MNKIIKNMIIASLICVGISEYIIIFWQLLEKCFGEQITPQYSDAIIALILIFFIYNHIRKWYELKD